LPTFVWSTHFSTNPTTEARDKETKMKLERQVNRRTNRQENGNETKMKKISRRKGANASHMMQQQMTEGQTDQLKGRKRSRMRVWGIKLLVR